MEIDDIIKWADQFLYYDEYDVHHIYGEEKEGNEDEIVTVKVIKHKSIVAKFDEWWINDREDKRVTYVTQVELTELRGPNHRKKIDFPERVTKGRLRRIKNLMDNAKEYKLRKSIGHSFKGKCNKQFDWVTPKFREGVITHDEDFDGSIDFAEAVCMLTLDGDKISNDIHKPGASVWWLIRGGYSDLEHVFLYNGNKYFQIDQIYMIFVLLQQQIHFYLNIF